MAQLALLLRGINVGGASVLAMADLRDALATAGFHDPRTLLRSGNVVVDTQLAPDAAAAAAHDAIEQSLDRDVAVVARTHAQLAELVADQPLAEVATSGTYLVTYFLDAPAPPEIDAFAATVRPPDVLLVRAGRRELVLWCPLGQSRSDAVARLTKLRLPTTVTARNWNTVTKLLAMFG